MSMVYGNKRKDSRSTKLSRLGRNEMTSALAGESVLGTVAYAISESSCNEWPERHFAP